MEQKSVLIVEDDAILAIHLRDMLIGIGYSVPKMVATGGGAIAAVTAERYDLILMDIQLIGEMDGITTAEYIRSAFDVPIVFLTSYSHDDLIQRAKKTAPYGYLIKPVSERELAATIETAIHKHEIDRQLSEYKNALQKAHDELEQRVLEQTADLHRSNEILCSEIEEHRRVEASLQESEERYRRITEGLTDYLYSVRVQDGKVIDTTHSPTCKVVTGYSQEEYAADPHIWSRMVMAEDRNRVLEYIENVLAGDRISSIEHRIIHKNGHICWVRSMVIPQYNSQGALMGYDGVIKDITEKKLAEEQLFNSNRTLTMTIDGISDPIVMLDAEYRIKRLNKAARNYYGLSSYTEAFGKYCFEAFRGRSSPCEGCERPFSDLQNFSGFYERKGGNALERIEQVFVYPVKGTSENLEGSVIRIFDITHARMMDRQLMQSEKLASLGLLVAGVAHEINNPNTFIFFNIPILRSYIDFLLPIVDEYVLAHPELKAFGRPYPAFREDYFKLMNNIEHGSIRINQIVKNLREYARERGEGERCRIDLKQVVEKSISICLGCIKKCVKTFETRIPDDLPALVSDPLAIEQIMVNLLINAAQAADKDDSWVRLTVSSQDESDGEVIVEVSDNGCGMDTETQKKIFDPFFTTKGVGEGTGLGMSISQRLVTDLRGRIEVHSELGKGSIFRVILNK